MSHGTRGYGGIERQLARWLDRFPRTKLLAKQAYERLNYIVHVDRRRPAFELHPVTEFRTPAQWAGLPTIGDEWFFGYYDVSPWSPDMQRMLLHRLRGDQVQLIVVDRPASRLCVLGDTRAWNAQQGSRLQWRPGTNGAQVLFNDVSAGQLGCRLVDVNAGTQCFLPWPIQTISPTGREALTLNYRRLHRLRPEYGYAVAVTNFSGLEPLEQDGIWCVNLDSGRNDLIISLAALVAHAPRTDMATAVHKVNHLLYAPAGTRFVFMHRWTGSAGRFSRLYVAQRDGTGLHLLMDDRMVSHYHWRDDDHLLVWGRTADHGDHYYLIDVNSAASTRIGAGVLSTWGDGHPSFSPDRRWIVTDTYPDRTRRRHLLLFETATDRCIQLGSFFAPWRFDGPRRCDLHPRWSPDGRWISFDSAHEGLRRSYLLRVEELCAPENHPPAPPRHGPTSTL